MQGSQVHLVFQLLQACWVKDYLVSQPSCAWSLSQLHAAVGFYQIGLAVPSCCLQQAEKQADHAWTPNPEP